MKATILPHGSPCTHPRDNKAKIKNISAVATLRPRSSVKKFQYWCNPAVHTEPSFAERWSPLHPCISVSCPAGKLLFRRAPLYQWHHINNSFFFLQGGIILSCMSKEDLRGFENKWVSHNTGKHIFDFKYRPVRKSWIAAIRGSPFLGVTKFALV